MFNHIIAIIKKASSVTSPTEKLKFLLQASRMIQSQMIVAQAEINHEKKKKGK